ncbi:MAG TPA: hypothetical protein VGT05_04440 [Patescibacteria group bacterium]|nr:hypothetical protein [Patescibacteria group bacterium]
MNRKEFIGGLTTAAIAGVFFSQGDERTGLSTPSYEEYERAITGISDPLRRSSEVLIKTNKGSARVGIYRKTNSLTRLRFITAKHVIDGTTRNDITIPGVNDNLPINFTPALDWKEIEGTKATYPISSGIVHDACVAAEIPETTLELVNEAVSQNKLTPLIVLPFDLLEVGEQVILSDSLKGDTVLQYNGLEHGVMNLSFVSGEACPGFSGSSFRRRDWKGRLTNEAYGILVALALVGSGECIDQQNGNYVGGIPFRGNEETFSRRQLITSAVPRHLRNFLPSGLI